MHAHQKFDQTVINAVVVTIIPAEISTAGFLFPTLSEIAPKIGPNIAIKRFEPAINTDITINTVGNLQPIWTPNNKTNGVNAKLITDCEKKVSAIS